jgi:hypothetical protein
LPNTKIPIFPEDFPPNGPKEHSLRWWGIVEPTPELLVMHERVACEVGYPIGKRKREDGTAVLSSSDKKEEKKISEDVKNESKSTESDRVEKDRSKSSRHRHSRERDERRGGRDERRSVDRDRRSR